MDTPLIAIFPEMAFDGWRGDPQELANRLAHAEHPPRGPRVPAAGRHRGGHPAENTLLPGTMTEIDALGVIPRELVGDGGFMLGPTRDAIPTATGLFLSGRHEPGSRRTRKRQARFRTGCEGRISHLKRRYGVRRSRLKGHDGQRVWTGWAILAYNPRHLPPLRRLTAALG